MKNQAKGYQCRTRGDSRHLRIGFHLSAIFCDRRLPFVKIRVIFKHPRAFNPWICDIWRISHIHRHQFGSIAQPKSQLFLQLGKDYRVGRTLSTQIEGFATPRPKAFPCDGFNHNRYLHAGSQFRSSKFVTVYCFLVICITGCSRKIVFRANCCRSRETRRAS
jgi:hypothetical protein